MIRTFNECNSGYCHFEKDSRKQKIKEDNYFFELDAFCLENVFYYLVESSDTSIGKSLHDCELTSKCFLEVSQRVKSIYFSSLKIPLDILGQQKATKFIQQYKFADFAGLELTLFQTPSGLGLTVKGNLKIDLFSLSGMTNLKHLELIDVKGDLPNLQNYEILERLTIAGKTLKDSAHNFAHIPFAKLVELSIDEVGFIPEIKNIAFPTLKKLTLHHIGFFENGLDLSKFPNIELIDFTAGMDALLNYDSFTNSLLNMETLNKATFNIHCRLVDERVFLHYEFYFIRN